MSNAIAAAADAARVRDLAQVAAEATDAKSARSLVKRLVAEIEAFEKMLDERGDVGLLLVSFGQANSFRVTSLGYLQPNLIIFQGVASDGQPVRLIQHMSQLSFLLTRIARVHPEEPRKPIGFHLS